MTFPFDAALRSTILRNSLALGLLALAMVATWGWFRSPPPQAPWTDGERETLLSLWIGSLPPLPPAPGNAVADRPQAQRLGHRLFFDVRLSANGQVSCATCHQPARNFTDGVALAQGLAVGELNTMSLVGAAYSPWFFWDGRKDSLWSQALSPLESPIEQGIDRARIARLIADDPMYRSQYEALFGSLPAALDPDAATAIFVNIGKALAAYQRLLLPGQSAFDRYVYAVSPGPRMEQIAPSGSELGFGAQINHRPRKPVAGRRHLPKRCFGSGCARPVATLPASSHIADRYDGLTTSFNTPEGERRTPTLSRESGAGFSQLQSSVKSGEYWVADDSPRAGLSRTQTEGLRLFIGKAQCLNCHNGPLLTNFEFHNTGVLPAPGKLPDKGRVAGVELARADPFNCLGPHSDAPPEDCAELRFARAGADRIGARKTPSLRNLGGTAPFMHAGQLKTLAEVLDHYNRPRAAIVGHNEAKPLNLLPFELKRLEAFLATLNAPIATPEQWLVPPPTYSTISPTF